MKQPNEMTLDELKQEVQRLSNHERNAADAILIACMLEFVTRMLDNQWRQAEALQSIATSLQQINDKYTRAF